ncbi:hypothetical protein PGB90_000734 [Kerria lacca]
MDYVCTQTIDCGQGAIRAVRYNVDGNYCLTCGSDKKIKLWNPNKGLYLNTYAGHGNEVLDVASSCDNSQIVSCGIDKTVILWDVIKAQPLRRLRGHAGKVTSIAFNEESTAVVSSSEDNRVMCWDIKSRQNTPIQVLKDANDCVMKVKVTANEILTGSLDCRIRRYDIRMGELIEDYIGEYDKKLCFIDPVTCVTFTSDEQCVLASCTDETIKLFDKKTGELLGEYSGHKTNDYYIECCIDKTDSFIFSGSIDGSIWCWDLVKMNSVNQLIHNKKAIVHSLSSNPIKKGILSASGSNIKVWMSSSLLEDTELSEI